MNICFVSNFSKTYLFEAIAQELEQQGHQVFWICNNQKLHRHLLQNTPFNRVLLINKSDIHSNRKTVDDFKINELVYGDRVLKHHPNEGLQFLRHIQQPIYQFIKRNHIQCVFGEITWAHEILIHRICTGRPELNCQYLNPHVVRIPNRRFTFFSNEDQSKIFEIDQCGKYHWEKLRPKVPHYLGINQKINQQSQSIIGRLKRLKRFITNENMDILDPTLLSHTTQRIKQAILQEVRKSLYNRFVKTKEFNPYIQHPYVFIGLHKQPEASIDAFGRYYEDQLQNIKNIWRNLPLGWTLVVKEHSVAIGDRPLSFYKSIQALPGVVLVSENTPSYLIIKKAALVVTVTGTIALEAALHGIPSATFAPTFFNRLNRCTRITLADLATFRLDQITGMLQIQSSNIMEFSKYIYKHSFDGNVLDPISDSSVLDTQNIHLIAQAFEQAIAQIQSKKEVIPYAKFAAAY